jgi:hypothetical protein
MSQDEVEQILPGLPGFRAASQAVAQELGEWSRAHPKARLPEIETAVRLSSYRLAPTIDGAPTPAHNGNLEKAGLFTCAGCSGS